MYIAMKHQKFHGNIMTFCELRDKEVVNIIDGKRLGCVIDIEFDITCGIIRKLILPPQGKYFSFFSSRDNLIINWDCIERIGYDLILVRLTEFPGPPPRPSPDSCY